MGRKKRTATVTHTSTATATATATATTEQPAPKRSNNNSKSSSSTQCYPIKKYRADKIYPSMDLFLRYTKTHKMVSDAVYEEHSHSGGGATDEKPLVFRVRIGSHVLGYGRGATRDEAIDHAIRASFYLVQAHGYDTNHVLEMNEHCLTKEPEKPTVMIQSNGGVGGHLFPPPPPPPLGPPPASAPNGHNGQVQSNVIVQQPTAIPQPQMLSSSIVAPTATVKAAAPVQIAIAATTASTLNTNTNAWKSRVASSSNMVFETNPEDDECMEEMRAKLPKYAALTSLHAAA